MFKNKLFSLVFLFALFTLPLDAKEPSKLINEIVNEASMENDILDICLIFPGFTLILMVTWHIRLHIFYSFPYFSYFPHVVRHTF